MNRKLHVFTLLIFCVAIQILPTIRSGTTFWDIAPTWSFYSTTTGGPITFSTDFIATQIQFLSNLVIFDNFNMGTTWTELGFHCPTGATLQVDSVATDQIDLTTTIPGAYSTYRVYVGGKGAPTSVSGANSWTYGSGTVTMDLITGGAVVLSWAAVAPTAVTNLITQYLAVGDLSGYIIAQFTSVLGLAFFALIALIPVLGTYIKAGTGPAILVILAGWGIFAAVIPGVGLNLVFILLVLGIGLYLARLVLSRRSSY